MWYFVIRVSISKKGVLYTLICIVYPVKPVPCQCYLIVFFELYLFPISLLTPQRFFPVIRIKSISSVIFVHLVAYFSQNLATLLLATTMGLGKMSFKLRMLLPMRACENTHFQ